MNITTFFHERCGFTRNEISVVIFLAATFAGGLAVQHFLPPPKQNEAPAFDFSHDDSTFNALRAVHDSSSSAPMTARGTGRKALPAEKSVNINTAGVDQLMQLPGIGQATAQRIMDFRRDHGPFRKKEDVINVKGIGPRKLEKLLPYLKVR